MIIAYVVKLNAPEIHVAVLDLVVSSRYRSNGLSAAHQHQARILVFICHDILWCSMWCRIHHISLSQVDVERLLVVTNIDYR